MNNSKKNGLFDTIALISLCIGTLFYINNRILPKSLYFFAFSALLMFPSVLYNIRSGISKKIVGFILFFIYLILCLLISYSSDSFEYIIYYFFGVIYFLYFSKRKDCIEKFVNYYYVGSIIFTIITIFSVFFDFIYLKIVNFFYGGTAVYDIIVSLYGWHEYSGIAGQTGYNAFVISIGIIVSLLKIIYDYKKSKFLNKKTFLILLFQASALFLCSKRAIILYVFTTIILLLPLCINIKKKKNINKLFAVLFFAFLAGSISINFFEPFGNVFVKNSYYIAKGNILNGRLPLYSQALDLFKNNFLLGIGIKRFYLLNELNLDVHNVYLQLLAENGIIGFIIVIISFLYMFFKTKKNLQVENYDILTCISLGVQIFFLLYALTGNTLYDVNMLYIYFILGSLSFRGENYEK